MDIPHTMLSPETLRAVTEEFVLREGTEYGEREVSLSEKVDAVMKQLVKGDATVVYDPATESCSIARRR